MQYNTNFIVNSPASGSQSNSHTVSQSIIKLIIHSIKGGLIFANKPSKRRCTDGKAAAAE